MFNIYSYFNMLNYFTYIIKCCKINSTNKLKFNEQIYNTIIKTKLAISLNLYNN